MSKYTLSSPVPDDIWARVPEEIRPLLVAREVRTLGQLIDALRGHVEACAEFETVVAAQLSVEEREFLDQRVEGPFPMGLLPPEEDVRGEAPDDAGSEDSLDV